MIYYFIILLLSEKEIIPVFILPPSDQIFNHEKIIIKLKITIVSFFNYLISYNEIDEYFFIILSSAN